MKRSKKTLRVFALLFGIIGILATLIFGIIGFRYFLVYNNREIAYARVIEINNRQGYTVVRYTTNDQSYNRVLRMIDSSWYENGYIGNINGCLLLIRDWNVYLILYLCKEIS